MARIIIPTPLRKFTGNNSSLNTEAIDVGKAMKDLVDKYPEVANHLLDKEGKVRSFIKVFVGENDVRSLENDNTPLNSDTVISIVPAIAGGSI